MIAHIHVIVVTRSAAQQKWHGCAVKTGFACMIQRRPFAQSRLLGPESAAQMHLRRFVLHCVHELHGAR